jgi:hypothetical protein
VFRLSDAGLRGKQGVTKYKIRQVRVVERYRTKEQRLILSPNPHGHPAVVFNRSSWHGNHPLKILYTFKSYMEKRRQSRLIAVIPAKAGIHSSTLR